MKDGDLYLIFNTLSEAIEANLQIFENISRDRAINTRSGQLYNKDIDQNVSESAIPAGGVASMSYPIVGIRENSEIFTEGFTTSWGMIWEREDLSGSYVLPKPIAQYMTGVVGVSDTQPRQTSWFPTEE